MKTKGKKYVAQALLEFTAGSTDINTEQLARDACAALGLTFHGPEDAEQALWPVELTPELAERLEDEGYLEIFNRGYRLTAETP